MVVIISAGAVSIIIDAEFLAVAVELSQFSLHKYLSTLAVAQHYIKLDVYVIYIKTLNSMVQCVMHLCFERMSS